MKKQVRKRVKRGTPRTAHRTDDKAFTSYDTRRPETATPQDVREASESVAEEVRSQRAQPS